MLLGVSRVWEREELNRIRITHIEDYGDFTIVKISSAKNNIQKTFVIIDEDVHHFEIFWYMYTTFPT